MQLHTQQHTQISSPQSDQQEREKETTERALQSLTLKSPQLI